MKKSLSKEELIARLKAIAADPTPKEQILGAMCYSQMSPPEKRETCQMCGKEFVYSDWHTKENITKIVNKMISLGYDVKINILCSECGDKVVRQLYPDCRYCNPQKKDDGDHLLDIIRPYDINFLFFFRTKSDEPYHQALANYSDYYKTLYSLMKNQRMYRDSYDSGHYIDDEKDILQFMTGINFDE